MCTTWTRNASEEPRLVAAPLRAALRSTARVHLRLRLRDSRAPQRDRRSRQVQARVRPRPGNQRPAARYQPLDGNATTKTVTTAACRCDRLCHYGHGRAIQSLAVYEVLLLVWLTVTLMLADLAGQDGAFDVEDALPCNAGQVPSEARHPTIFPGQVSD